MPSGLRGSLGTISITMSVVDRASKRLTRIDKKLGKTKTKVGAATENIRKLGSAITAVGAVLNETLNNAYQMLQPFETSLARVSALTSQTSGDFDTWYKVSTKVAKNTTTAMDGAAKGMYYIASAGVRGAESIQKVATEAGKMVKIHGIEWPQAARSAVTAAKAFQISMDNIDEVTNVMNATVASSLLTMQDFAQTLKYAGPVAGAVGWSIQDMSAALSEMADVGIRGSKAGTTLRAMLTRLAKPTGDAVELISRLNLELFDMSDVNKEAQNELAKTKSEFQKVQGEISDTKNRLSELSMAMEDYSIASRKARLKIRKMRFKADREDRELTQDETDRIERLGEQAEGLAIKREELAIKASRERQEKKKLKDESSDLEDKINNLTETIKNQMGELKSWDEVMAELSTGLMDLGEKQRLAALKTLFGRRAVSGIAAVLNKQIGFIEELSGDYESHEALIEALTGANEDYLTTSAKKLQFLSEERKKGTYTNSMYKTMTERAGLLNSEIAASNRRLRALAGDIGRANTSMTEWRGTMAGMTASTQGLLMSLINLSPVMGQIVASTMALGPLMSFLGPVLTAVAVHAGMAGVAFAGLFSTMMKTGGVVFMLAAVFYLLYKTTGDLRISVLGAIGAFVAFAAIQTKLLGAIQAYIANVNAATVSTYALLGGIGLIAIALGSNMSGWKKFGLIIAGVIPIIYNLVVAMWELNASMGALLPILVGVGVISALVLGSSPGGIVSSGAEHTKEDLEDLSGQAEETFSKFSNQNVSKVIGSKGGGTGGTTITGTEINIETGDIKSDRDIDDIAEMISKQFAEDVKRRI